MEISEEDKTKFENCQEHRQIGYLCDVYVICNKCPYQVSDEIYVTLSGKMVK